MSGETPPETLEPACTAVVTDRHSSTEATHRGKWPRVVRWIGAALVLLVAVVGSLAGWFKICSTKMVPETVETTCQAPQITDGAVIAFALLLVALVWPELSEVDVFGFGLKRQIKEVAAEAGHGLDKARELERTLALQSLRVDSLFNTVNIAKSTASVGDILIGDAAIKGALQSLPEKRRAFLDHSTPPGPERPINGPTATPTRVLELISKWQEIQATLDSPPTENLRRVTAIFDEEIRIVRASRNAAAHAKPLTATEVSNAIEIADQLIEIMSEN